MLGLPDIVYQVIMQKSTQENCELVWTLGGHNDQTELVLRWMPKGSVWEDPFMVTTSLQKHKSPACRRRDFNRKRWHNVSKNSVASGTEDISDFQTCKDIPIGTPTHSTGNNQHDRNEVNSQLETSLVSDPFDTESNDSQQTQEGKQSKTDTQLDEGLCMTTGDSSKVIDKDNYEFVLFKRAINDEESCTLSALSIDNRVYQYHYGESRVGPVCILLRIFSVDVLEAKMQLDKGTDILKMKHPPWHDHLIHLHEFAKLDFEM